MIGFPGNSIDPGTLLCPLGPFLNEWIKEGIKLNSVFNKSVLNSVLNKENAKYTQLGGTSHPTYLIPFYSLKICELFSSDISTISLELLSEFRHL